MDWSYQPNTENQQQTSSDWSYQPSTQQTQPTEQPIKEQQASDWSYQPSQQQSNTSDVANAKSYLGSQSENGECQQFVEQAVYGKTGIFPSAAHAANYYQQNGQLQNNWGEMQPGSLIYFQPDASNGYDGHVGIYEGNNTMISATYNGVQETNLSNWMKETGQQPIGYVTIGGKQ